MPESMECHGCPDWGAPLGLGSSIAWTSQGNEGSQPHLTSFLNGYDWNDCPGLEPRSGPRTFYLAVFAGTT